MSTRLVVGIVSRTDNTPWRNAKVTFRRCKGTYTPTNQYPPDTIIAYTNQDGELYSVIANGNVLVSGVYLWCNAKGASYTPYECQLPNDSFTFKLPVGDTPITLSALREGSDDVNQPQYESIIDYVDTSIDKAITGLQLGSTQIYSNEFIATTNLSALRIVNLVTGTYASAFNQSDINGVFGITTKAVIIGEPSKLLLFGELFDNNFNLFVGNVYLSNNGLLIQNLIGNELFILNIGNFINTKKMLINIQEAIRCNI